MELLRVREPRDVCRRASVHELPHERVFIRSQQLERAWKYRSDLFNALLVGEARFHTQQCFVDADQMWIARALLPEDRAAAGEIMDQTNLPLQQRPVLAHLPAAQRMLGCARHHQGSPPSRPDGRPAPK